MKKTQKKKKKKVQVLFQITVYVIIVEQWEFIMQPYFSQCITNVIYSVFAR